MQRHSKPNNRRQQTSTSYPAANAIHFNQPQHDQARPTRPDHHQLNNVGGSDAFPDPQLQPLGVGIVNRDGYDMDGKLTAQPILFAIATKINNRVI